MSSKYGKLIGSEFYRASRGDVRSFSQILKSSIYDVTGMHTVSVVQKMPRWLAARAANFAWGRRVWLDYPLPPAVDGRDLLFIHIPKCAGTSVAMMFGRPGFQHFPAYSFLFSDPHRFENAKRFTIIRNPVHRLASALLHLRNSGFSTAEENARAEVYGIKDCVVDELVYRVASDKSFEKSLFSKTRSGLSGFCVPQVDWVSWNGRLLVDRIYSIESLGQLCHWLGGESRGQLGELPHANRSRGSGVDWRFSERTVEAVAKRYPADVVLWNRVVQSGGVLVASD